MNRHRRACSTSRPHGARLRRARFLGIDPSSRQIPDWLYDVSALEGKGGYFASGNCSTAEVQAICLASQLEYLADAVVDAVGEMTARGHQ